MTCTLSDKGIMLGMHCTYMQCLGCGLVIASAADDFSLLTAQQSEEAGEEKANTIPLKIIIRMKSLFSNYLGDYSYSFRGSSELIGITQINRHHSCSLLVCLEECSYRIFLLRKFSRMFCNYSYMI